MLSRGSDSELLARIPLLALVVCHSTLQQNRNGFHYVRDPVLLKFRLVATTLVILLRHTGLVSYTVASRIGNRLLRVTVTNFQHRSGIVTVLFSVMLLPITKLITNGRRGQHVANNVFRPNYHDLLGRQIVRPRYFAIEGRGTFVELYRVPIRWI